MNTDLQTETKSRGCVQRSVRRLWLIRPLGGGAWEPWYDKTFGFVVRADSEEEARKLANAEGGDETSRGERDGDPWLDPKQSICAELTADGEKCVIIRDFAAA